MIKALRLIFKCFFVCYERNIMEEIKVLNMVVTMLGEIPVQGKYAETYAKCLNTLVALQKTMEKKENSTESGD